MTAPVVAVTGAVGAGKSTFCALLAARGARVLSADLVAHEVLREASVKDRVRARFGDEVFGSDGEVSHPALARKAFSSTEELKRLTDVVYPVIAKRIAEKVAALRGAGETPILLEAPTLFESGCDAVADLVVTVEAAAAVREERSLSRGWDKREVHKRESFLLGEPERRKRAQLVVENSCGKDALERQAAEVWGRVCGERGA